MIAPIDMLYSENGWSTNLMPIGIEEEMHPFDPLPPPCRDGAPVIDCTEHGGRDFLPMPIEIPEDMHPIDPLVIEDVVTPVVTKVGVKIAEVITTPVASVTTQSSLVSGLTQSQRIAIVIALGFAAWYLLKDKKN